MEKTIEVTIEPTGYTVFSIGGEKVLAYQVVRGTYHLIPAEEPAQSYTSAEMASKAICSTLKRKGGDLLEFLKRSGNPFLLPL